jgi:hypothetical protein
MTARVDAPQMRAMIREVIREALPELVSRDRPVTSISQPSTEVRPVRVASDEDLNALVQTLITLLGDPDQAIRLRAGTLVFSLETSTSRPNNATTERAPEEPLICRFDRGAITEKAVNEAAERGNRIVIAGRAVLTPLARDRARKLRVEITRERG